MKIINLALFLFISSFVCSHSYANDAHTIFYQAFEYAKAESPFSQQINWELIEKEALQFIGDDNMACRGTSAISNILAPALSKYDFHTFVTEQGLGSNRCPAYIPKEISSYWQGWMQLSDDKKEFIMKKLNHYWGKRLDDVAYIYIPGGFANSNEELEAKIREGRKVIESLNLETASGVIVDFRMNSGGHYFPMLMSLVKIINPATLFKYTNGENISLSEDGNALTSFTQGGLKEILYQVEYLPPVNRVSLPIVILVDEATESSGAITAFALKENSSTNVVIGERTSPTLSANATLLLQDGNHFNLMMHRLLSPNDVEQPLYLDVDYKVNHDFDSLFTPKDQAVKRAIKILAISRQ